MNENGKVTVTLDGEVKNAKIQVIGGASDGKVLDVANNTVVYEA